MSDATTELTAHYSTNSILRLLKDFTCPARPFDPDGHWVNSYHICMTVGRVGNRVGSVTLTRTPWKNNETAIGFSLKRMLTAGFFQTIEGGFVCASDALSRPLQWQYRCSLFTPDGRVIPNSTIEKSAEVRSGKIIFKDSAGRRRRRPVPADYACSWTLFDAVQRLPVTLSCPLAFMLIDHFDEVRLNHVLSKRETTRVSVGNESLKVNIYQQFGEGVLPIEYWVADSGRLLWVVSGIEAYILDAGAEGKTLS